MTLVIAKSHMHHGNKEYRIICRRGQIKQKRRGGTSNEVELNNDGYAVFATPLSLHRSKANEKIGSKPRPSKKHTTYQLPKIKISMLYDVIYSED